MERICIVMEKSEIDTMIDLLKDFLHIPQAKSVNPKTVIDQVCQITGYSREQITGRRGKRDLCDTRACISALIYYFCPKISKSKIGLYVNRDHATVLHHLWMVDNYKEINFLYEDLKSKINILT